MIVASGASKISRVGLDSGGASKGPASWSSPGQSPTPGLASRSNASRAGISSGASGTVVSGWTMTSDCRLGLIDLARNGKAR